MNDHLMHADARPDINSSSQPKKVRFFSLKAQYYYTVQSHRALPYSVFCVHPFEVTTGQPWPNILSSKDLELQGLNGFAAGDEIKKVVLLGGEESRVRCRRRVP